MSAFGAKGRPLLCYNDRTGHAARDWNIVMAKGQQRSNREVRKPKKEQPKKQNASNPSQKEGVVRGLDNMKN